MPTPPHTETGLIHALADGELTRFDASRLRSHLARCPACAKELGDLVHLEELGERLALLERARACCLALPLKGPGG